MQLFYCDKTIINYEKKGLYSNIIEYLENSLEEIECLSTYIAYAWYLYSEGQFINDEVSRNWAFYLNKWKKSLNLAENCFNNSAQVSFIAGYTLEMNGMDLAKDLTYENKIKIFYDACKTYKDDAFKALCENIILKNNKTISNQYLNELFPNDTIIDNYFKEILSRE